MSSTVGKARSGVRLLDDLSDILRDEKQAGKKIVHCHGVFDLLHVGHIRHLEQAKGFGDVLVVTITPDEYVNKGPSRPAFGQDLRAEVLAALDCVDYVAINKWPLAAETIKMIRPDYYVKGQDYKVAEEDRTGGIVLEEEALKSVGGQIVFTDDITFSSSNLINRHLPVLPENVSDYLADFSQRYSAGQVLSYLESTRTIKTLVIGETIIDEYVYCETMGKSGKEPVLAARQVETERFAGGVVAVTNHVAALCDNPSVVTFLGHDPEQLGFIQEKLAPNVSSNILNMANGAGTIVKRRYMESYPFQKLFEVYLMDSGEENPIEAVALCDKLQEILPSFDVVIVTDYGHGMIGPEAVEVLTAQASFLAINTQVNAGNLGFNTVSKYPRADFICVSENEMRLEARSRRRDIRDIVSDVGDRLSCDRMLITRGEHGSLCYSKEEGFSEVPAFAARVVDRIGAGDAVFSVAALCAVQKAPMEIVGVIGNAVGAEAVATMGHRTSIQRVPLVRHIESLLK